MREVKQLGWKIKKAASDKLPGFIVIARLRWDGGCHIEPPLKELPNVSAIYALLHKDQVRYIGSAENLRRRLGSYLRRQNAGATSPRPVHKLLHTALYEAEVYVLCLTIEKRGRWVEKLPVDMMLGAEAGLIATLIPDWNRRKSGGFIIEFPGAGDAAAMEIQ
ncbi:GIY-YIG nuclease family protein [Mesorhizobium sp. B2-3-5]|uniref:GIY-YIG nuclease family protein n=1 Tax=Mesorhizobium sp. B2-3-5 TaxID=2589958 RepID=UPI0015E4868C|nr:GIY-YIG nuclease family protein [Mesorhizobium sp. B2-3-5]